jgi:hypothetical protein
LTVPIRIRQNDADLTQFGFGSTTLTKNKILLAACLPVPVVSLVLFVVLHPVGEDGAQKVALLPPAPLLLLQVNLNIVNF